MAHIQTGGAGRRSVHHVSYFNSGENNIPGLDHYSTLYNTIHSFSNILSVGSLDTRLSAASAKSKSDMIQRVVCDSFSLQHHKLF